MSKQAIDQLTKDLIEADLRTHVDPDLDDQVETLQLCLRAANKRIAELEETNRAYKEAWSINILTERIAQLEGLIADLECNGVFCGLDNQLCDNCRIRFEAL